MAGEGEKGETDREQQTEDASAHRLEQMRSEGQVPRSADATSAVVFVTALITLSAAGPSAVRKVAELTRRILSLSDVGAPLGVLPVLGDAFLGCVLPVGAAATVAAVAAGLGQTRGLVVWKLAAPDLKRFDVLAGLMRLLPSRDTALEMGKSLLKLGLVGAVAWRTVDAAMPALGSLARQPLDAAIGLVGDLLLSLVTKIAFLLVALGALDFFLAWRRFHADARMTKQQVKDEYKEQEGDPHIKGKRRARARQLAKARAKGDVKNATVIVTNPTHIACALRYVPGKDAAPLLVAKAEEEAALEMRKEARKLGIPIVEDKPLARAMYGRIDVGENVPVDLYEAVARIIAHVFALRGGRR